MSARHHRLAALVVILGGLVPTVVPAAAVQDQRFAVEILHEGVGIVPLAFGPGGRLYAGEKRGRILLFRPDPADPEAFLPPATFASLEGAVRHDNERGLLGLAFHPDVESTRWLYAFYSYDGGQRLVRFEADATFARAAGAPVTLLEGLPNAISSHNGGDIQFHPVERLLYVTLGDDGRRDRTQDPGRYNGKILRLDEEGRGVAANPFFDGDPDSIASRIWGIGCRNPFRFTFHPITRTLYVSENGNDIDRVSRWGAAGGNGGWPDEFDTVSDPNVTNLLLQPPAITGIAIVRGGPFADLAAPGSDAVYVAKRSGRVIRRWRLTGAQRDAAQPIEIGGSNDFVTGVDQLSHLVFGPDGALYAASSARDSSSPGRIYRVRFTAGTAPAAAIATSPDPATGPVPLTVAFTDDSSDDGTIVSRLWEFGDGSSSAASNPSHTYLDPGVYTATLTVTDDEGLQDTEPIVVTANRGVTVRFSGTAVDGRDFDGRLAATELRLFQIDGRTPLPFAGGAGPGGNAFAVSGAFDRDVVVELVGPGLVVTAGEPVADVFQPVRHGVRVPAGATQHDASVDLVLSDTVITGRITDTRGDPARVDIGVSREGPGRLFPVPGGRDYTGEIPPSGVEHRVESDELGYWSVPLPSGSGDAEFHLDLVADTGRTVYLPAAPSVFVSEGAAVDLDVVLGLQAGGADCLEVPGETAQIPYDSVQAIFDRNCTGCHSGLGPNAGLDLAPSVSPASIVGVPSREVPGLDLIEPGDPARSFLFEKVNCALPQVGSRMPTGFFLDPAERATIRRWIEIGAPPPFGADVRFSRGDANADGRLDLSDGIFTLLFVFAHRANPACERAADSNADGRVDVADPIFLFNYIFLGGVRPPDPFQCGVDPVGPSCANFPPCG